MYIVDFVPNESLEGSPIRCRKGCFLGYYYRFDQILTVRIHLEAVFNVVDLDLVRVHDCEALGIERIEGHFDRSLSF